MINRLSIVTINFNNKEGLLKTIKAVESLEWVGEHVLVDGASTDGSLEIIKAYSRRCEKVVFLSESDQGPYDAMNKGLDLVTSGYVWFLNSGDDFYGFDFPMSELCSDYLLALPVDRTVRYGKWKKRRKYKFKNSSITMPYNHQGLIFPYSDLRYNQSFQIAADYHYIGELNLPIVKSKSSCITVFYEGGGISYQNTLQKYDELEEIAISNADNVLLSVRIKLYYMYKKIRFYIHEIIF